MNLVDSYNLWYDGAGMHDIRATAKTQLLGRLSDIATSRRVAEKILRDIDYAGKNQSKVNQFKNQLGEHTTRRTIDYITHIHQQCQSEIESKWGKPMDDAEFNEILFEEKILQEIDKLKINKSFEITL